MPPIITVGTAPDNAGEQLQRERQQMERDFSGEDNRYNTGGRHDFANRGMSSDIRENPDSLRPQDTYLPMEQATYATDDQSPHLTQPPPNAEVEDVSKWKKLYGDSENEKGALRKLNDLYEQKLAALEERIGQQLTSQQPQIQQPNVPTYEDFARRLPQRFIADKGDDDFVQAQDVERLVRDVIAPALWQVSNQTTSLAQAQLAAHKQSVGITPSIEASLGRKYPWLAAMGDGLPRINALQSLIEQEHVQQQQEAPKPREVPVTQQQYSPSQAAARRVTYIEPGRGTPAGHDTPSTSDLFMKEMQQALQQPYGEPRRAAMEAVYKRYGVNRVNDYRDPTVLTR